MQELVPESPSVIVRSPAHDERALSEFTIPNRMGYRWRNFNHRVAAWRFGLSRDRDGHPWADRLETHSSGGPFTTEGVWRESPELKYGYQRLDADSTRRVGASRRRFRFALDSTGVRRECLRLDRDELRLTGYDDVVAAVVGFGFDTSIPQLSSYPGSYEPDHGYLTRGIGVGVRVVEVDEESVELSLWLRYGFGAAMDRPAHNRAILEARVGAELDVALIGVSDTPVHRGCVSYVSEHDEPKIGVEHPVESVPRRLQRIEIDGTPSAPAGFFGLQAFNFDLTPERSCEWNRGWPSGDQMRGESPTHPEYGPPGYYIRELTVDLQRERYDRSTGRGSFLFDGFASNATYSIPFHPLRSRFTGRMLWVQADADRRSVDVRSEFPTGRSAFGLRELE